MAVPTPPGMSAWKFVTANTFSGQASFTLQTKTQNLSDGLNILAWVLVGSALVTGTNAALLQLQLSTGGSVDAGANYAFTVNGAPYATGTDANQTQSAAASAINIAPAIATAGAGLSSSFTLYIWSPTDAVTDKNVSAIGTTALSSTTGLPWRMGATWANTAALDGFKILASAGNINTGQLAVYELVGQ